MVSHSELFDLCHLVVVVGVRGVQAVLVLMAVFEQRGTGKLPIPDGTMLQLLLMSVAECVVLQLDDDVVVELVESQSGSIHYKYVSHASWSGDARHRRDTHFLKKVVAQLPTPVDARFLFLEAVRPAPARALLPRGAVAAHNAT